MSSKKKQLLEDPANSTSLYEMCTIILNSNETKYVETLMRVIKNELKNDNDPNRIKKNVKNFFKCDDERLNKINDIALIFYAIFIEYQFKEDDLVNIVNFFEYAKNNKLVNTDLTKYKELSQIIQESKLINDREEQKRLEKEVVKIYETDEWVVVKPMTYEASKKYGSNTKWCTSSEDTSTHFLSYTKNGMLIYMINKKINLKYACHVGVVKGENWYGEITFWDERDQKIDSINIQAPDDLLLRIKKELKECKTPNSKLKEVINKQIKTNKNDPVDSIKKNDMKDFFDKSYNTYFGR